MAASTSNPLKKYRAERSVITDGVVLGEESSAQHYLVSTESNANRDKVTTNISDPAGCLGSALGIGRSRMDDWKATTRMGIGESIKGNGGSTYSIAAAAAAAASVDTTKASNTTGCGTLVTLLSGGPVEIVVVARASTTTASTRTDERKKKKKMMTLHPGDSLFCTTTRSSTSTTTSSSSTEETWRVLKETDTTTTPSDAAATWALYEFNSNGFTKDDKETQTRSNSTTSDDHHHYYYHYPIGMDVGELEEWPFTSRNSNYVIHTSTTDTDTVPKASGRIDHSTPTTRTGIWRCTRGMMECTEQGDELMTILSGNVQVTDVETGQVVSLQAGDVMFSYHGKRVIWNVLEDVTKVFFGFKEDGY
jgi:uncharacterized cupin superfamily protein